ncbi:MAG: hypothetical protein ACE5FH_08630 [Candidatus Zixiibacteriota bacterium]
MWPASGLAIDPVGYAVSDVRVLYVFTDAEAIDWPTLYYLNNDFGCRVDLLKLSERAGRRHTVREVAGRELFLHDYAVSIDDPQAVEKLADDLFVDRRPDMIIFSNDAESRPATGLRDLLLSLPPDSSRLFDILKIYERSPAEPDPFDSGSGVVLNGRELSRRFRDRMEVEIPKLYDWYQWNDTRYPRLTRYRLLRTRLTAQVPGASFVSGIQTNRLLELIERLYAAGPLRQTQQRQARLFHSAFGTSRSREGKERFTLIASGFRELTALASDSSMSRRIDSIPEYRRYLTRLLKRSEQAALEAAGIQWDGKVLYRDSPHGPRLKFRVAVSVNGPQEVELSDIMYMPYWDSVAVPIDTTHRIIAPHQSYVREYLIGIDKDRLERNRPDSIEFSARIMYSLIPLDVRSVLPIREVPDLKIRFEPHAHFVQPMARLDIDRVVSSLSLKAVITKPMDFAGTAHVNLGTPHGMFAGAYRQEVELEKGVHREVIRVPFTLSNLFELGTQQYSISLSVDGQLAAADTGLIRIAACHIDDTRQIGFLHDSSGALEDILRMTDAAFRPLTARTLEIGDLNSYQVIVFGSNSFRSFANLRSVRDSFEKYLRQGGSIVILPQGEDWPEGVVPISLATSFELVAKAAITNRLPQARILNNPYRVSQKNLLSAFYRSREVYSAAVAPAEKVFVTSSGGSLLSVSRIGDGQIIYCGFPILEMMSRLDIDAIHLFANLLNY